MRTLLIADDCNPEWPSLPIVGYKQAKAIAKQTDIVLITHIRNKPNIEKAGMPCEVVYVDNEWIARPIYKLNEWLRGGDKVAWTINTAMGYPLYSAFAYEVRKFINQNPGRFDIVHRLTPMSPTIPAFLPTTPPFVIGPLNGGLPWPKEYMQELKREKESLTYVRNVFRILPGYRAMYKNAAAVLGAFPHTMADLPSYCAKKLINFPEVGFDPELFQPVKTKNNPKKTILFTGRLVPYKCADVLVKAFVSTPALHDHQLLIIGDGPERAYLESLAKDHLHCISFAGWKTQPEVAQAMQEADIFAFPSIRELGAGVVVEAMASGLPSIVVDYGGPGGLIDVTRGIKIPLTDKEGLVRSSSEALTFLIGNPYHAQQLGSNAQVYAYANYTWDAKASKIIEVYEWVLGKRPKPSFY